MYYLSIYLFVCLFHLSIDPSDFYQSIIGCTPLQICLSKYVISLYIYFSLYICVCVYVSVSDCMWVFIHPFFNLSLLFLSIHLSQAVHINLSYSSHSVFQIYLSIYLSIYSCWALTSCRALPSRLKVLVV